MTWNEQTTWLKCGEEIIISLNASRYSGRTQITLWDYVWISWRIIGAWYPFLDTNFAVCWWIQCRLANCADSETWIHTSSHSYTRMSFTLSLVSPDNLADFSFILRFCRWFSNGKPRCRGTLICSENIDACNPDRRWWNTNECCAKHNTNWQALENQEDIGIEIRKQNIICFDTNSEYRPG